MSTWDDVPLALPGDAPDSVAGVASIGGGPEESAWFVHHGSSFGIGRPATGEDPIFVEFDDIANIDEIGAPGPDGPTVEITTTGGLVVVATFPQRFCDSLVDALVASVTGAAGHSPEPKPEPEPASGSVPVVGSASPSVSSGQPSAGGPASVDTATWSVPEPVGVVGLDGVPASPPPAANPFAPGTDVAPRPAPEVPAAVVPAPAVPAPVESAPVESAPVESAPVESAPVSSAPVESPFTPIPAAAPAPAPATAPATVTAPVTAPVTATAPATITPGVSQPVESGAPVPVLPEEPGGLPSVGAARGALPQDAPLPEWLRDPAEQFPADGSTIGEDQALVIENVTYLGGHPAAKRKRKKCVGTITRESIEVVGGRGVAISIPWSEVVSIEAQNPDEARFRISTRIHGESTALVVQQRDGSTVVLEAHSCPKIPLQGAISQIVGGLGVVVV